MTMRVPTTDFSSGPIMASVSLLGLAIATAGLVISWPPVSWALAALATPPDLSPTARLYVLLIGSLCGWICLGVALAMQLYSPDEQPPLTVRMLAGIGLGLLLVFNGIVIRAVGLSIALRVVGYMLIVATVVATATWRHALAVAAADETELEP